MSTRDVSIVDVLKQRAERQGEKTAFTFLSSDGGVDLTFGELDRSARAVAVALGRVLRPRRRVLLLLPPGDGFPRALFGAFYAGAIAVPAPLPDPDRLARTLPRLRAMMADARPAAVLTTAALLPQLREILAGDLALPLLAVDAVDPGDAGAWERPETGPESLAFLQYTSGSTASPKGVMISHASLLAGAAILRDAWEYGEDSRALMWVPDFHDDGLVHGNVLPVFTGHRCWRMPAAEVVRRPASWLEAISRHRITHSGGPNFVYELCVRRVPDAALEGLDLSSWKMAYNAAEPVRSTTLERFAEKLAPCGFSAASLSPAFGLAEATLLVTTRPARRPLRLLEVDVAALECERRVRLRAAGEPGSRTLVSCGAAVGSTRLAIAVPETLEILGEDRVGEVLVASPSLAEGYWNQPEASSSTFIDGLDGRPQRWLRTGDLGFLHAGELYVNGRLKDLILIRGRNLYPQDLELTAERSDPALRPGCGAAFPVDGEDGEELVVVHEVDPSRGARLDEIARRILQAVSEEHEVLPSVVALIPPRAIPKTSSGKIRRSACREAFLAGNLEILELYRSRGSAPAPAVSSRLPAAEARRKADETLSWLRSWSERRLDFGLMDERRSLAPHAVLELGNHGLFGLAAAPEHGGLGLPMGEALRILQQLGAIDLSLACLVLGQSFLGTHAVEAHATEEVRQKLLPALASGRQLSALALTEEGAGSNPQALSARGRWDPGSGSWTLHGTKVWIGTAAWAGVAHVFVRTEGGPDGREGITGFVLPLDRPGVRIGPEIPTFGLRAMVQGTLHLEGARVTPQDLLGRPGGGMEVAQDAFARARLAIGAVALGGLKRCAQLLVRWAERRSIATGRLLDHPVLRERWSDTEAAITALDCLIGSCARQLDAGRPLPADAVLTAKIDGAESLWQTADGLLQALGSRGYAEPNLLPRLLRDARALRLFEGPTETLTAHLGSRAAHGEEALFSWLGERDRETAAALRATAERAQAGAAAAWPDLAPLHRRPWMFQRLGELTRWAVLGAAVAETRKERGDTEPLRRAADWIAGSFQELRQRLEEERSVRILLSAGQLREMADGYRESIGDLEPFMAGEERGLDPLLRRETPAALPAVAEPVPAPASAALSEPSPAACAPAEGSPEQIEAWLTAWTARQLGLDAGQIDRDVPLSTFVDSVIAVMMIGDLGDWLGRPLDPALPWKQPSIAALSLAVAVPAPLPAAEVKA